MTTVTVEIVLWNAGKIDALLRKIEADARVMQVTRIDTDYAT